MSESAVLQQDFSKRLREQKRGLFFRQLDLQSMILPGVIAMIIFNFLPLYGLTIAFKNYRVIMGVEGFFTAPWVGFKHFTDFFRVSISDASSAIPSESTCWGLRSDFPSRSCSRCF